MALNRCTYACFLVRIFEISQQAQYVCVTGPSIDGKSLFCCCLFLVHVAFILLHLFCSVT